MALKFIYFDLGKVLLNFDRQRQFRQMAEAAGCPAETVREIFYDSGLYTAYERGEFTTAELHEKFCRAVGLSCDLTALVRASNDIFWPNASMIPVVSQLWSAGYRLGILSNTCDSHWQFVSDGRYGILPRYFEQVTLSFEVGVMKPDVKIYEAAADKAGVAAGEIFFTDDLQENVDGALAAGWDAVLYTSTPAFVRELRRRGVRFNF